MCVYKVFVFAPAIHRYPLLAGAALSVNRLLRDTVKMLVSQRVFIYVNVVYKMGEHKIFKHRVRCCW